MNGKWMSGVMVLMAGAWFWSAPQVAPGGEPAGARTSLAALVAEIAPADGPVRPPFDLARHDMGLVPQKGAERTAETLRKAARERQERLVRAWEELKPALDGLRRDDPEIAAESAFLAYAFGRARLDAVLAVTRKAGAPARLRLARLLLAECRFDEAVGELTALADGRDAAAQPALVELARHAEERKRLSALVPLVPLAFDLEDWLAAKSRDKATGALIAAVRRGTAAPLPELIGTPTGYPRRLRGSQALFDSPVVIYEAEEEAEPEANGAADLVRGPLPGPWFKNWGVDAKSLDRTWLELQSADLILYRERDEILSGDKVALKLWSAYGGTMTMKLYRFRDRAEWEGIRPEALARAEPVWTGEPIYRLLDDNNSEQGARDEDVGVTVPGEGYYLLTCSARYAPQLAVQKFCVSHAALCIRAGRNQVVVAAVDRRTGAALAGEPIEVEIAGRPDARRIVERLKPERAEAFRAGLEGGSAEAPREDGMQDSQRLLAWSKAYVEGQKLAERYPRVARKLSGRTGKDGTISFPADLAARDYSYTLKARRPGAGLAEVSVGYSEPPEPEDRAKAVVWCDQPIYRPGSTVHFKGMVRRFNGLRVAPHDARWKSAVDVQVRSAKDEVLWKGRCALSAAGAFSGDLRLAPAAELGAYRFLVDGREAEPSVPFTVEEFRLPSYWVSLSLDRRAHRGGEKAAGTVVVHYFSGKPVDGAAVELVLETGEADPPSRTVVTDAEGRARFELAVPQVPRGQSLPLRATVADPGGVSRTLTRDVLLTGAPFRLRAEARPWPAVRGTPVEIVVDVTGWDDRPVAGASVTVAGSGRAALTDAEGRATVAARAAADGDEQEFAVTAAKDGEAVHDTCRLRLQAPVAGAAPEGPAPAGDGRPAHRDSLSVGCAGADAGEPLTVSVEVDNALDQESTVLLFVENTRLLAFRSLVLRPGRHDVSIPTDQDFAPNVYVSALAYNGRGELRSSDSHVSVRPVHQFMTVEIATDKAEYRPGERCAAELRALDHRGRPVPGAEISLGVIHEAIYSLREDPTPDLQDFYWRYWLPSWPRGEYDCPAPHCPPAVWLRGPKYAWGHMESGGFFGYRDGGGRRRAVGRFGGSAGSARAAEVPRRDFRTSAHWVADLVTDAEGRARTSFAFPDDITAWRFTARGLTADTRVGSVRASRRTLLPLQVELALPRALRSGDRITAAALVHNNRGAGRTVSLEFAAAEDAGRSELAVAAGGTRRADVPLGRAGSGAVKFTARVRDAAGDDRDAIERSVPVAPRGCRVARSYGGLVRDGGAVPLALGGELLPGSLRASVAVEPGLAGPVESALDGLIGYPYGCVEQTMSRFMPAVVAGRAMRAAGIESPRAGELPDIFEKGLARLAGFQHADGGWGWWQQDPTNDFMTAYVLEGLVLCRSAGHAVPAGMIDRGEKYLAARLLDGKLSGHNVGAVGDVDIRVFAAHSLGVCYSREPERYGEASARVLAELRKAAPQKEGGWSDRDAALRGDALRLLGDRAAAEAALEGLANRAAPAAGDRRSTLTAATVLELGAALRPADGRWAALGQRLVGARKGGGWGDTVASAAAVRGLAAVLAAASGEPGPVEVLLDGRVVATLTPERNRRAAIELGAELAGCREIVLRPKRKDSAGFWSARVEGWLEKPPAPPANPDVRIACRYFRLAPERAEIPVGADGRLAVAAGTTIEVRLEYELARPLSYLRISLPRPAGVELVRQPDFAKGKLVAFEERDDGLHCFADAWEAGRHEVSLLVRPEFAGEVFAPPPEFEPMYGDAVPVAVRAAQTWVMGR